MTEETKRKIGLANKGRIPWIKGKKQKPETIAKRIETRRRNGTYVFSDEWKRNIGLGAKGRIPVKQIVDTFKGNLKIINQALDRAFAPKENQGAKQCEECQFWNPAGWDKCRRCSYEGDRYNQREVE